MVGAGFIVDVRTPQQEGNRALFDVAWRFQYVIWLVGLSAIHLQSKAWSTTWMMAPHCTTFSKRTAQALFNLVWRLQIFGALVGLGGTGIISARQKETDPPA